DADAKAGLSHCKSSANTTVLFGNDDTFENLKTFLVVAFLDSDVDSYGVAGLKSRNIAFQLVFLNKIKTIHYDPLTYLNSFIANQPFFSGLSSPSTLIIDLSSLVNSADSSRSGRWRSVFSRALRRRHVAISL